MYKKVYVPLILALVAALSLSSVAYAATPLPVGVIRRDGTVLSVDLATNTFKFDTLSGVHYTIHVSSATVYVGVSRLSALSATERVDLELRWQASDGTWWADRIKLVPQAIVERKEHGVVTSIGAGSFTIRTSTGLFFTFWINSKTTFSGKDVPHLRELDLGDAVTVTFRGQGTPKLWAMHVQVTRN